MTHPENAPPKIHDRDLAEMSERLALRGLMISAQCAYCGRPIWQESSLQVKAGPVCRRRQEKGDTGTSARKSPDAAETIPTT